MIGGIEGWGVVAGWGEVMPVSSTHEVAPGAKKTAGTNTT